MNKHNELFNLLLCNWKKTIDNDLLKIGYGYDDWYISNLRNIEFEINKLYYSNSILSEIKKIQTNIKYLNDELEYNCTNFISVTI